jgi:hypothetical protein
VRGRIRGVTVLHTLNSFLLSIHWALQDDLRTYKLHPLFRLVREENIGALFANRNRSYALCFDREGESAASIAHAARL